MTACWEVASPWEVGDCSHPGGFDARAFFTHVLWGRTLGSPLLGGLCFREGIERYEAIAPGWTVVRDTGTGGSPEPLPERTAQPDPGGSHHRQGDHVLHDSVHMRERG